MKTYTKEELLKETEEEKERFEQAWKRHASKQLVRNNKLRLIHRLKNRI